MLVCNVQYFFCYFVYFNILQLFYLFIILQKNLTNIIFLIVP